MRLEERYLAPASNIMTDYINGEKTIRHYFSYEPSDKEFARRYDILKQHEVDREKVSSIIRNYMGQREITEAAEANLKAFEKGAPVVVTGQQAGLLTGPLYTVHKAISVVVLAKQASEQLKADVVPVFWIAGEDHDLAEISHLYREVDGRIDKMNVPHRKYGKHSASTAVLDKEEVGTYLEEYFRSLPETDHTKKLHAVVFDFLDKAKTFTDFFAEFLNFFFKKEGLLYIDAANPQLRKYESPYFVKMINRSKEIAETVVSTEQALVKDGYSAAMEADRNAANLFVTVKGERVLLQRDGQNFTGNQGAVKLTKEELLEVAKTSPELLSNNVVTRPVMQEMVFPVLAFVGGPGEIAYWAALKNTFQLFDMEMPVVMPRLGMTIVNRQIQTLLQKYRLTFPDIVEQKKLVDLRNVLFESIREKEAESLVENLEQILVREYEEIKQKFSSVSGGLTPLVEKNLEIHLKQLRFLKDKLEDEVILQNSVQFTHFNMIENELFPNGSLQERIYSPIPYMNHYGLDMVQDLLELSYQYDKNHKIIWF
ncbi:bacillithiol biosynthesis cysteine-adding enzyme BshC [Planococcus salinus]|uniref:Putative cysteine ligase BshC n=1 Tax=Planococcus salinus TaxID=1848460 RepID=A0A3M8PAK9_9BACL|nr:bacillithiol biosynthesis cysteine-adding enzyme BshC [Planococcus salinus]RNF40683.1 bacillithiol biosynthesis cysteine-adding enzyme BshC [Planococcus salinus]